MATKSSNKNIFEEILISPNHNEQIVSIICSAIKLCSQKEYPRINKILKDIISNNKLELKKSATKVFQKIFLLYEL